jgi:F-type H+-transporting ATPase subunit gamma
MASLRDIRRRIKSVKNTRQITKAMQLVAASKMKRAQDAAMAGRDYAVLLAEIVDNLGSHLRDLEHPYFTQRPVKRRGVLVLSTDKGLCGALNANLFRVITNQMGPETHFVTVGRKAKQFIARTQRELLADFEVPDKVAFSKVRAIIELLCEKYENGEIDSVEVLYPAFVNTLVQEPRIFQLLPFTNIDAILKKIRSRAGYTDVEAIPEDPREMKFEPSVEAIIQDLPRLFIRQELYQLLLESKASEHSARMVAMKSASDNASKLADRLSLEYNKARQAAITQEILEIAAAQATN